MDGNEIYCYSLHFTLYHLLKLWHSASTLNEKDLVLRKTCLQKPNR